MISTTDERGVISNFARDPKTSAAEYPSPAEQRTYWLMGIATTILMAGVFAIAYAVS